MTRPAAIRGTYADLKRVKTRAVWQVIVEVPDHDFGALIETIGAPDSGVERWLGIAPLHPPASQQQGKASDTQVIPGEVDISTGESSSQPRPRRSWDELTPTQQAGIRCGEDKFREFLLETFPHFKDMYSELDTAALVRRRCNVSSRKELTPNINARQRWLALENQYQAWLAKQ